jgi:hypothetical protein
MFKQHYIISHTEENAIGLTSVGYSPLTLTLMAREKYIYIKKNESLSLHRGGFCFVYNKPKGKFIHSSTYTEH